jgi:hypothetical protein
MATNGFEAIKPEVVVDTALALLEREVVLPNLVWRDAVGDFRGAKGDTVTIRLPAYAKANKRQLRSSDARVRKTLHERKIDVTLTHDLQVDVPISDENLTLDIRDFAMQVLAPGMRAIVRSYEDEVAQMITGATYVTTLDIGGSGGPADALDAVVQARKALNDASVPAGDRVLACGSSFEAVLLRIPELARVDASGSDSALREATIGRLYGFTVVTSPALPPDHAYAFHRSAYVLASRAPAVPRGASWGAEASANGFAIRVLEHLDASADIVDVVALDAWVGRKAVTDKGKITGGKFEPAEDPNDQDAADHFVRAVKITL